jgi:hypothetical protein
MPQPLCRYPVRTPPWVISVLVAVSLAAVLTCMWLARGLHVPPGREPVVWALYALVAGAMVLAIGLSRRYLVASGSSIDIYQDLVDVPRPWRGHVAFPLAELSIDQLHLTQLVTAFHIAPVARLNRGTFVTFRSHSDRRVLSDRVFVAPGALDLFLADLDAVRRGEAPRGPAGWASAVTAIETLAAAPRDPFEARLDAELRDA